MRLSGLQNPQAARPVAPVSTARPGNIPGWRLTPYPGYEIARPTHSQPPSERFPGGGAMRLSGLQNCPAYTFTAAIGPLSRRQRVYAKSAVECRPVA